MYRQYDNDVIPEDLPVNGEKFHFVFIIDRSYSMEGENIVMARKALMLFVQSLPIGCKFSIISFGDRYEMFRRFGNLKSATGVWEYSDEVAAQVLKAIENFEADFGGTDLE